MKGISYDNIDRSDSYSTVAEAAMLYFSMGAVGVDNGFLKDKWKLSELIRTGISYELFDRIRKHSPFSLSDWAELLSISYKSLLRYKQDGETFKSSQSERIIEVAEVTEYGIEVFGDRQKFKNWLDRKNFALGSVTPRLLLADSYGKDLVMKELAAIEYGIFA